MSINNSNRIEIIDYLKGVALCGVLLMHVTHFGGFRILPFEILNDLPFSRFDKTIFAYLELLIKGKFFAIFSVMFGWSLAKSIEKFGHNNKSILYRRALLLLAIGLIHTFIFYLDILVAYAICSLLIITIGLKVVNKPFKVYLIAFASFIMLSFIIDFYELKFILANGVKAKTARLEYPNLPSQKIWDWFQSGDIVNILRLNMIQLKYYLISNMYSLQFIYIFLNILLGIFLYKIKFHMNVFNKK
ncbi:MAG: hypothetical protein KDD58_04915, partial [Bdellovibrionales bacterium]|nr:hypothetical protein [Bdellovibrionales bacterium]